MIIKAIVYRGGRKRFGKGFSKEELKTVGLNIKEATTLKIPVDNRRKTKHEENVRALRDYLTQLPKKT
ncbi:MAG: ribosomal protein L13e [Candidatus Bathyarchaeia archaeon]|nr:ribosomal protein L13e [Candidatus Bathyarchaeota archaeon]